MSILNITYDNFGKGKHELHKGMYERDKINAYIDRYERQFLIKLLGADLYNEFKSDLTGGVPTSPRFQFIFNEFEIDLDSCGLIESKGMIEMIKGFVWYKYLVDQGTQVHVAGVVRPDGENSENPSTLNQTLYNRYNESIMTYKAIQRYICDHLTDYDQFNGRKLYTTYWI
jgi:hypothetical protein